MHEMKIACAHLCTKAHNKVPSDSGAVNLSETHLQCRHYQQQMGLNVPLKPTDGQLQQPFSSPDRKNVECMSAVSHSR